MGKSSVHYIRVRTAVIVATYDQPRWLDLSLRAWGRQELRPSFVVVADDGSGLDTAEVVRRWAAQHVRREREAGRFGKCSAVNAAVRRARELGCDFALFTDGDCLPAAGLLARHVEVARRGRFAAGGVVRLSQEASLALTGEGVDAGAFERARGGDKRRYALPRGIGRLIELAAPRRTPWKGGNSSAFLDDVLRVNGYDERFGWGSEDKELGERLSNAGVRGYSIRYTAPVFHLWHERPYVDPDVIARNRVLLAETRRTHSTWTPSGIRKSGTP
jgi:glycosyltransferase involved in cell wall biosynthesis